MTTVSNDADPSKVKRRRVFYIPGYDPFHPRRYRELYRKESAIQANISRYNIEVKGKTGEAGYGWDVVYSDDLDNVSTSVEVLVWSDIVRSSMATNIPKTYFHLVRTAWIYISTGALLRLMRLRKGPIIAALFPVFALIFQLIIAVFAGVGVGKVGGFLPAVAAQVWFWVSVTTIPILVLRWFNKNDGKFFAYYLMHDFAHTARDRGAISPELARRLEAFKHRILEAATDGFDEVLVVGHSSGAHLAVSVLAEISRDYSDVLSEGQISFMSIGHVIPMVTFLPKANDLRRDLHSLSGQKHITWVDVSAPGDGCSFALCDPAGVSGVAPEDQKWPIVFSAAFTQSLSAERWKQLRWRFFRLHFQYLCAFDRPKDYDYFKITAGPLTLTDRYKDRPSSKSVIRKPTSGYRSMS
jgi:hypothetical protein